jgi:hypothetical protein
MSLRCALLCSRGQDVHIATLQLQCQHALLSFEARGQALVKYTWHSVYILALLVHAASTKTWCN